LAAAAPPDWIQVRMLVYEKSMLGREHDDFERAGVGGRVVYGDDQGAGLPRRRRPEHAVVAAFRGVCSGGRIACVDHDQGLLRVGLMQRDLVGLSRQCDRSQQTRDPESHRYVLPSRHFYAFSRRTSSVVGLRGSLNPTGR
jgi:hypothetical protein